VAKQVFRYHKQTLEWITGDVTNPERFRHDLFKVTGIRGSDLQAIALLMGHGASATTAEHYLHVVDWSLSCRVRHHIGRESEVIKFNAGHLRSTEPASEAH
jgi:hypothetical protein